MAIDFSELTYPQALSCGDMEGSYDYQYYRDQSTVNAHWYSLATVNELDLHDGYDPSSATLYDIGEYWSLPNGYSLHLQVANGNSSTSHSWSYISVMYDENGQKLSSLPSIRGVTFGRGSFGNTPIAYANMRWPIYCHLTTIYYPATPIFASNPAGVIFYGLTANGYNAAMYDQGGLQVDWTGDVNEYDNWTNISGRIAQSLVRLSLISFTQEGINNFNDWLHGRGNPFEGDAFEPTEETPDTPAGGDDTSEPGGGGGNYDDTSDPVDFPDLPVGGAIESGAVIAHRVSKQTLEVIFTKLWNKSLIDITNVWQKSIQDPMDAIVSLHALPVSPEVAADPDNIAVGNLDMGVTSPLVTSQYVEVDCGTLNVKEFWGSALDYSPYTRVEIFLPFIGIRTLRTEDVMKSTLHIKYHVDVLSGDCIAFIKCGISVLYTYNGNCKMLIPLSSRSTDFLQKAAIAAGLAVGAAGVAVGGGAAAAAATKAPAVAAAGVTQSAANLQAGSMLISGASNVASTKINTQRSGDISSALSLMAEFVPYLIIHRPVQSLAKNYNKYKGYTSNITAKLGNLTGYTEVEHVHLQNIPNATDAELAEIHSLLVGGVII